ncbi:peptidoglycan-binding domain-containing protein [Pseudorhodobacter ferrugineus]|uniref:peptidoglycan-binding domain-containing protein n=1 Tax=Pseudorhodobacter ferrugineus TaxID=77008 RepID=UPI0003B47E0E|nr:peptidoglycan-binding domain-containing protein [Pseudorhodobacter ferrugineus]
MLLTSKTIAFATALSLTLGAAVPAHAWGRNEQNFLKGVAAALIVGAIVHEGQKTRNAPQTAPKQTYRQPVYQEPAPRQTRQHQPRYQEPKVKTGRVIGQTSPYGSGVNDTTAARVFNRYSYAERIAIQRQLARFGYYSGTLDGSFGPRTHQAVYEFARKAGKQQALASSSGAYRVYDALLG